MCEMSGVLMRLRNAAAYTADRRGVRAFSVARSGAAEGTVPRRQLLGIVIAGTAALQTAEARADLLKDIAIQLVRPEDVGTVTAVVRLLDAKSVLRDIQALANTPMDSKARFESRALLPGYAKRLREVGPAIGTLSLVVSGRAADEARFSERYGGTGVEITPETAAYISVGRTITISGRTVQKAALEEGSSRAAEAIDAIDAYLSNVPASLQEEAQSIRVARAKRATA